MTAMTIEPRSTDDHIEGVVLATPRILLRLEGLLVLAGATMAYAWLGASWWMFALLFLIPDLSMLGYLVNRRIGAAIYNAGHSYLLPACLAAFGWLSDLPNLFPIALIWVAHIGFDRAVGYGLKYPDAFKHTHLGNPF